MRNSARAKSGCESTQGDRVLRHLRLRWHIREYRSACGRTCRREIGPRVEPVSTQVIPRDRHATFFATLGVVASFDGTARHGNPPSATHGSSGSGGISSPGQKGSSSMPHKRNPVLTENITGLARMVRAYVTPALENVALWHERDISHSSVERYIGPDATVTLDFALVRPRAWWRSCWSIPTHAGKSRPAWRAFLSQRVLLALTQAGVGRGSTVSFSATRCARGTARATCYRC